MEDQFIQALLSDHDAEEGIYLSPVTSDGEDDPSEVQSERINDEEEEDQYLQTLNVTGSEFICSTQLVERSESPLPGIFMAYEGACSTSNPPPPGRSEFDISLPLPITHVSSSLDDGSKEEERLDQDHLACVTWSQIYTEPITTAQNLKAGIINEADDGPASPSSKVRSASSPPRDTAISTPNIAHQSTSDSQSAPHLRRGRAECEIARIGYMSKMNHDLPHRSLALAEGSAQREIWLMRRLSDYKKKASQLTTSERSNTGNQKSRRASSLASTNPERGIGESTTWSKRLRPLDKVKYYDDEGLEVMKIEQCRE
ncbi:MAG: hypothetical protein L6R35_006821 [Caloplaca aegaea]|nr:MAG: hypothetical protein L6R35_006821 [Caloplaca aegaea]